MSVNVVDVEQSNVECLVISVYAIVVTATLRLESVDLDAIVTNDYGGVGRGQENGWEKDGSEPHDGLCQREERREAGAGEEKVLDY